MKVIVELLGVLRRELDSSKVEVSLEGLKVCRLGDLLKYLLRLYPKMSSAINGDGTLNTSYVVFVNDVDFMVVGGYDYEVRDGDKITFIPISHGGLHTGNFKEVLGKLYEDLSRMRLSLRELCCEDALTLIRDIDRMQVDGCITQILPSTLIMSDKQLLLASLLTFKAIEGGKSISRKPYIEFLLRLFSKRQINEVINMLKTIKSDSYLLIRVCKGAEVLARSSHPTYPEVNPSDLFKRYNVKYIYDLIRVYDIVGEVGLDLNRVHSLILTKISLFNITS